MINIRVTLPQRSMARALRAIDPNAVRFAEVEALNGTLAATQKLALKEVADEMGISVAKLKKRGRSVNQRSRSGAMGAISGRKASRRGLRAVLIGAGKPFNVSRWNAQEIKSGARTSIKTGRTTRGKGRVVGVVHEAWGRRQVALGMWRLGKGNSGPVVVRDGNKIRGAYGPGVTHVMMYDKIRRKIEAKALREFPPRFIKRVRYALSSRSHVR